MLSYSTPMQFVRIAAWSNVLLLLGARLDNQVRRRGGGGVAVAAAVAVRASGWAGCVHALFVGSYRAPLGALTTAAASRASPPAS